MILIGLWGMAGFLTFLPIYARELGLDGAGLPLAIYAVIIVGLRIIGARWPDRFGAARLSGAALAFSAVGLAIIGPRPDAGRARRRARSSSPPGSPSRCRPS